MTLHGVNWAAVVIGSLILFVLGGIEFGPKTLYPLWWKAMNLPQPTRESSQGQNMFAVFGLTYVGTLAQSIALSAVLHGSSGTTSVARGAITGAALGLLIAGGSTISHRLFAQMPLKVWLIETAPDVANLTILGAFLAWWM